MNQENLKQPSPKQSSLVLIVDDVPTNLAVIHDALDESGYAVLVASNGAAALHIAKEAHPDVILLDAVMPEMDGFAVCRALKESMDTRHIPVVFMTGLSEAEHVAAAFEAGGTDYVTKPVRPKEVLARIAAHIKTAKMMTQTRSALDAFGQAAIAVSPKTGKLTWQTPLAREWMQAYFHEACALGLVTPPELLTWFDQIKTDESAMRTLNISKGAGRLTFSLIEVDADGQWIFVLRQASDVAEINALAGSFKLTRREAEVLYWTVKGKTNKDIADILEMSPRTVNKHLEHVFVKMGVETRTAAAALASTKLRPTS